MCCIAVSPPKTNVYEVRSPCTQLHRGGLFASPRMQEFRNPEPPLCQCLYDSRTSFQLQSGQRTSLTSTYLFIIVPLYTGFIAQHIKCTRPAFYYFFMKISFSQFFLMLF